MREYEYIPAVHGIVLKTGIFVSEISFPVRTHGVDNFLECLSFSGEFVMKMNGLGEVFALDQLVFLKPPERFCKRPRTHAAERIFQFTESSWAFNEISHDK